MRTTKEMISHGEGNFKHCTDYDDARNAMIDYAKEAINEVLKKYWESQNETIRKGGKFKLIDEIALEVMKNLS